MPCRCTASASLPDVASLRQRADVSAGVAASRWRWDSWGQTQWRGRRPFPRRLGWNGPWSWVRRTERWHDDHEGVSCIDHEGVSRFGSRRKRPRQHRWGDQHANSDPEIGKHPLVDGTVYIGSKWRHIPASNRSCPNRVARRSTVMVFLSSQTPRARPRRCRSRLSLRVVDNPGDHSRRARALTERQQARTPVTHGAYAATLEALRREHGAADYCWSRGTVAAWASATTNHPATRPDSRELGPWGDAKFGRLAG